MVPEICCKVILSSFLKQKIENLNRETSGNVEVFCVQMLTPLAQELKGLGSIRVANCLPAESWKRTTSELWDSPTGSNILFLYTNQPLYIVYCPISRPILFPVKHLINEKGTVKGKKQNRIYTPICYIYIGSGTWDQTPLVTLSDYFSPWDRVSDKCFQD